MKSLTTLLFFAIALFANPPQQVFIDATPDSIRVNVIHPIATDNNHYISEVKVQIQQGSKGISGRTFHLPEAVFTCQDSDTVTATFIPDEPLVDGDVILAKATCNSNTYKTQKRFFGATLYYHEVFKNE